MVLTPVLGEAATERPAAGSGFLAPSLGPLGRDAWRTGLRERGLIEGKNLLVEYRYFAEALDRLQL
jgi:putative ABC transport system substrate-binding protein